MNANIEVRRGDVFLCDLGKKPKGVQGGIRPVVIIQNDTGNLYSPSTQVIPLTGQIEKCINPRTGKLRLPVHVLLESKVIGIDKDSIALCEQMTTVSKEQLMNPKITHLDEFTMKRISEAVMISMNLIEAPQVAQEKRELAATI